MTGLANWIATFVGGCLLLIAGDALFGGTDGTGVVQAIVGAACVATGVHGAALIRARERRDHSAGTVAPPRTDRLHLLSMAVFSVVALASLGLLRLVLGGGSSPVVAIAIAAAAGALAAWWLPRSSVLPRHERSGGNRDDARMQRE